MKKSILLAHQSAEMYGSDKVLLSLVLGLNSLGFHPIVLLPAEGPLLTALGGSGIETHIVPVAKLDRKTLSAMGLLRFPFNLLKSIRAINRILKGRHIDFVYSNTLAVLGAAVWAKFRRIPHIWHVHELLISPRVVTRGFPWMLRLLADRVVCNSTMTKEWLLHEQPSLDARTMVIWNGLGPRPPVQNTMKNELRKRLDVLDGQLLVALVGRINRMKGQILLVEAATILWKRGFRNIHFLIVGSVFLGQEKLLDNLNRQIASSQAREKIHVMPFTDDVWNVWDACDIAVVPSTEPESFGMVAIEAMAAAKPVLVAAHGGVLDIVEHGVSGLHFKPNDSEAFADEIEKLIHSPQLRDRLGLAGRDRQEKKFSLTSQINSTLELLCGINKSK